MIPPIPDSAGGEIITIITDASLVTPDAVAVILEEPSAIPVTSPDASTVATEGLLLDHVNVGQVIFLPY